MDAKIIFESIVAGLAAQVIVGWISPFTPLLTGFIAGVVSRNEKEGTVVGFVIGLATSFGFVLRSYLKLTLPYIYPTTTFLSHTGHFGTYLIVFLMVFIGIIGGMVGGSMTQRFMERSYRRGEIMGEVKGRIKSSNSRSTIDGKPKSRQG